MFFQSEWQTRVQIQDTWGRILHYNLEDRGDHWVAVQALGDQQDFWNMTEYKLIKLQLENEALKKENEEIQKQLEGYREANDFRYEEEG